MFSFLSGYFTPKRKVLLAKGVNMIARLFGVNIVIVIALYIFTPFVVPTGINACLQPV
jgi:hypothetical protein